MTFNLIVSAVSSLWLGAQAAPNLLLDSAGNVPESLSTSALFSDFGAKTFSSSLLPYDVNSPLWSDGLAKTRYLSLPASGRIAFSDSSGWGFPDYTIFVKNFYLDTVRGNASTRKIIETRFLVGRPGNVWEGYSYAWKDDLSEAHLLPFDSTRVFRTRNAAGDTLLFTHVYPGRMDCLVCHTEASGRVLGVRTSQMNRSFLFGSQPENQLSRFNALNLFTADIGGNPGQYSRQPEPSDSSFPLSARVKSYLDGNCAQCHRPGGTGKGNMDFRFLAALDSLNVVDTVPSESDMGITGALRVKPGSPESSVVYLRMTDLGGYRMPPLASKLVDSSGSEVIRRWIVSLSQTTAEGKGRAAVRQAAWPIHSRPNPFSGKVTVATGGSGAVVCRIWTVDGILVRDLSAGNPGANGQGEIVWDGRDGTGRAAAPGTYIIEVRLSGNTNFRKIQLLK